ncbi:thermonuclease family protein [Limoniibacter endophyticus]|uniref:Membrane protein n=1 Tax=Limoniibacter endophyticus TaxID=1565040 RepID=A0A8J3GHI2_9HYPH|nr:hypothetical protein [Limoniibacter endophyticus]GHC66477.1 membrane protein [Limoniibacter endophyticus]
MELKPRIIAIAGLFILSGSILAAGERLSYLAKTATPAFVPEIIPDIPEEQEPQPVEPAPLSLTYPPQEPQRAQPAALPGEPSNEAPGNWKLTLLYQPVISSLTEIRADGHRILLDGIAPLDAAEQCGESGRRWPCGRFAVTAFRHFVRGRAIRCAVPQQPLPETITTQCFIGKHDLAAWLVTNGWADAVNEETYGAMAQAAIENQRGRHAPPPG